MNAAPQPFADSGRAAASAATASGGAAVAPPASGSAPGGAGSDFLQRLLASRAKPPAASSTLDRGWLKSLRGDALARVGVLNLPTRRDEAWRFTDLAALLAEPIRLLGTPTALQAQAIEPFAVEEATTRLVFVDGVHAPQLSSRGAALSAGGAIIGTLATLTASEAASARPHLGRHAGFEHDIFTALNTALLDDAAVIVVPRDAALAAPLHLLFVSTQPGIASHPRVVLIAEPGSAVTLIEEYVALHDGASFTNTVAEVVVGAGAQVEHVRVQREARQAFHLGRCAVSLAQDSRYHSVSVALGAKMSRLGLDVRQIGAGTDCALDGLALIGERQVADTHSFIDHAEPHGKSRQLHKCIVDGAAHAVFRGKVMVRPGAQRTDSAQSSRNLLLSSRAAVDTLPQLEIFADDVKCTHGATVGELDSEEVFYLRSRGLSETAARKLLTYAFGAEIIDRIPVASLRHRLEQTVLEQTAGQP